MVKRRKKVGRKPKRKKSTAARISKIRKAFSRKTKGSPVVGAKGWTNFTNQPFKDFGNFKQFDERPFKDFKDFHDFKERPFTEFKDFWNYVEWKDRK
jgi:hypothetical protein